MLVVSNGVLTLSRSLEFSSEYAADPLDEIVSDLYATSVYVEDQVGARPDRLYLAGFGEESKLLLGRLYSELDLTVDVVLEEHPGLFGYLHSVSPSAYTRKVAA